MNRTIAHALAESLINLDFISKSAGCVQEVLVPQKKGKGKRLPAATEVFGLDGECNREETYKDLIPDSSQTGILYFEDLGSKMLSRTKRRESWKGTLKLVCWLQVAEVCNNEFTSRTYEDIVCTVKDAVNQELAQEGPIFAGRISVVEEYPKRPSPFEKYDYDEEQNQHLIHPFDYFSLRVEYTVHGICNCGDSSGLTLALPSVSGQQLQADFTEDDETSVTFVRNKPSTDYVAYYLLSKNT